MSFVKDIFMIIEGNKKEIEAMEEFHKGNRQKGLQLQEEFAAAFRENIKIRIIVLVRKPAVIMVIVKNVLRYIEHIKNMFRTV